jgi:hypothetical protein
MKDPQQSTDKAQQTALQKGERNKLIVMSVLLVVVIVAFFTSQAQQSKHERAKQGSLEPEPEFVETVQVPAFTAKEEVSKEILDNRREDRVLLPSRVLDPFVDYVKGFSDVQFQAMQPAPLDAAAYDELEANPSAHRAEAYSVRGQVGDLRSQLRKDGTTEYRGWLILSDERIVHFIVSDVTTIGHYMRVDGLFVKLYRGQNDTGEWQEGPLLVGARAIRSYPEAKEYDAAKLAAALEGVRDDTMSDLTGLDGPAFEALWGLAVYAESPEAKAIDWSSEEVLELDNMTMVEVLKDGTPFRGKPFRIPASKNMGTWTENPGETPSRLDQVTTGWIGNWTWSNQAGVIKFIMPEVRPDLSDAELVTAKGFFLKVFSYEPRDGGIRQAPYFVLTEIEPFIPEKSETAQYLMWTILVITLLLLALFPVLLFRDKRKSEALQRDLVRRKQERRRRLAEEKSQS